VAEDKKKEGDGKAEEAKKKKGLPAIVMVAVGAVVGGAGVVFAVPPKEKVVVQVPKHFEVVDVTHPDVIEHEFNPKSKAGRGIARFSFKFIYSVREDQEKDAFELIKENWETAKSNALDVLANRSIEELNSEAGRQILASDLVEDLDRSLFPGKKEDKIARVERLIWVKRVYQ
jgi:flagellar basal body-associated protein FliL